jgi:hypothetical protein
MRIGITLNEVLRDYIGQLVYTYTKYIDPNMSITEGQVLDSNFLNYFKFKDIDEFNDFVYDEAALEIFGHADQLHDNIISYFNTFLMDIEDEEEHEIVLISREVSRSIPATLFFLSKVGCRAKNIKFISDYESMWDDIDVLVTATPEAIKCKPSGKIAIKINASYNGIIEADHSLDSIIPFIRDEEFRNKIINTKITNYEEL